MKVGSVPPNTLLWPASGVMVTVAGDTTLPLPAVTILTLVAPVLDKTIF